jgi:hypothetical protein
MKPLAKIPSAWQTAWQTAWRKIKSLFKPSEKQSEPYWRERKKVTLMFRGKNP